ncbi:hypothetical protein [Streptomyces sp. NBC_00212]|uniref:hypothetical protein n=1 Tax=Streptomyces sp. NBC_00212 TaxID=2975684 RepID=UPI00324421FA
MAISGPLAAELIPDGSDLDAFNAAYRAAKRARVPFVCVLAGSQGTWTAKVDVLTAPGWDASQRSLDLLEQVIVALVSRDSARTGTVGPEYFTVTGLAGELEARRVAAAVHAALYGDRLLLEALLPPAPAPTADSANAEIPHQPRVPGFELIRQHAHEATTLDDLAGLLGMAGSAVGELSMLLARATKQVLVPDEAEKAPSSELPVRRFGSSLHEGSSCRL